MLPFLSQNISSVLLGWCMMHVYRNLAGKTISSRNVKTSLYKC